MSLSGCIHYSCGCVVWSAGVPQDETWQSEVVCPECAEYQDSLYQEAMAESTNPEKEEQ
jgi:hypothetical protein